MDSPWVQEERLSPVTMTPLTSFLPHLMAICTAQLQILSNYVKQTFH